MKLAINIALFTGMRSAIVGVEESIKDATFLKTAITRK